MEFLKAHPLAAIALGIVVGIVFAQQIKRIPGIAKLPSV
jgi:hypothetical protein